MHLALLAEHLKKGRRTLLEALGALLFMVSDHSKFELRLCLQSSLFFQVLVPVTAAQIFELRILYLTWRRKNFFKYPLARLRRRLPRGAWLHWRQSRSWGKFGCSSLRDKAFGRL